MGLEGVVILELTVRPNGQLIKPVKIRKSSGHEILDQEAIRMVTAAAPFRGLPTDYDKAVTFPIPIRFKLN